MGKKADQQQIKQNENTQLKDPVLDDNDDDQQIKQAAPTGATHEGEMNLDLNEVERKKKMKVDERVRKLDEVMDKAGLVSGFDETDAIETLVKIDKKTHTDDVMRKNAISGEE